jgi:hypothetical protein
MANHNAETDQGHGVNMNDGMQMLALLQSAAANAAVKNASIAWQFTEFVK